MRSGSIFCDCLGLKTKPELAIWVRAVLGVVGTAKVEETETGARSAAVGAEAAPVAAVVEVAAVEGATVVEEAVGLTIGARVAPLVGVGAVLDVAAAAEAAAVNDAVGRTEIGLSAQAPILAAVELALAEGEAPTDSRSACCNSDWKRASSFARSDVSLARAEDWMLRAAS